MTLARPPLALPAGYPGILRVGSFAELLGTPFFGQINALCWERNLPGDFREIADGLGTGEGIVPVEEVRLRAMRLSPDGQTAREILLADLELLRVHDLLPSLDCIYSSVRDENSPLPTDVTSFHADSATVPADTFLCCYTGAPSEGLRNDEARCHIEIPETRAKLLRHYGGEDDAGFAEYLIDHYYDLHYAPLPGAKPFSFGTGNLWRIATEYPGSPVPPCIHRAPTTPPGSPPRLLLIS